MYRASTGCCSQEGMCWLCLFLGPVSDPRQILAKAEGSANAYVRSSSSALCRAMASACEHQRAPDGLARTSRHSAHVALTSTPALDRHHG